MQAVPAILTSDFDRLLCQESSKFHIICLTRSTPFLPNNIEEPSIDPKDPLLLVGVLTSNNDFIWHDLIVNLTLAA